MTGVMQCSLFRKSTAIMQKVCLYGVPQTQRRCESNYDPYPDYETPSPYRARRGNRRVHNPKIFTGGILPRPTGEMEDRMLPMPRWDPVKADAWTQKKSFVWTE